MQNPKVDGPHSRRSFFGVRKVRLGTCLEILAFLLCTLAGFRAVAQQRPKNVLVLFSTVYHSQEFLDVVEPAMRAHVTAPIIFYNAYLDYAQAQETDYRESMAGILRSRYADVKMDLVIVFHAPALYFAEKYRDRIFPGVPIVFIGVGINDLEGHKVGPAVTGVVSPLGFRETIDLALRVQPDTNAVAVVEDATNLDRRWLAALHSAIARHQDKVREIDILGPPDRRLLARVSALPPHTVVIFQLFPDLSNQQAFGALELASEIAKRLPTYAVFPSLCVNGCIGGSFEDSMKEWLQTGELASRLLAGARPEDVPILNVTDLRPTLDWRELRKWHIPESVLPPGSVILNRPPPLWESYRNYVIAVIMVIAVLLLLVIGLLWQGARKRKAEAVLRESEERFRLMADTTPSLIWMCDAHGRITYLNERRIAFTEPDPDTGYGEIWIANVHPEDVKNVLGTLYKALETQQAFSQQYRLRRNDGVYRWMLDVASPRVNGDGSFAGFIGSAIDTTDQKLAQKALEKVSGQLIEAQEKERSRIARDLHDDICQRLALLSMELEQANRATDSPSASNANLEEIRKHCSEISTHVHLLSHHLHSSKLDYLGAVAAIRGMCNELSEQHEIHIVFRDKNVPARLPNDISLCLFRVAQEAVHNAVKYSGADEVLVEIRGAENQIQLVIEDAGAGFDVEEAKKTPGLGMVSMQERLHLVHGGLTVESKPGKGTRILAVVPLSVRGGDSKTTDLTWVA